MMKMTDEMKKDIENWKSEIKNYIEDFESELKPRLMSESNATVYHGDQNSTFEIEMSLQTVNSIVIYDIE